MKKNPDLHDQADRRLETIGTHTARIKETSRVYGEKLAAVKALLETAVAEDAAALAAAEKALKKLMKKNKSEFFPADQEDRVGIPYNLYLSQQNHAWLSLPEHIKQTIMEIQSFIKDNGND